MIVKSHGVSKNTNHLTLTQLPFYSKRSLAALSPDANKMENDKFSRNMVTVLSVVPLPTPRNFWATFLGPVFRSHTVEKVCL